MDLVAGARAKLAHFRIKELKDVLTQLCLIKQGKKQDLVDRISTLLSDEKGRSSVGIGTVVKIIDDIYRKMQDSGATDLTSRSHSSSNLNCIKLKVEVDDTCQLEMKVRCLCGSSLITDSMIKCEDHKCQVWQHIGCVMVSEKHMEGSQPELPSLFYCELCRLSRADPFWLTVRHPVLPLKLTHGTATDRTKVIQNMEKTFTLSRADRELLQRTDYDLQVWCILLNDQVYYRMHWPLYSELVVNGVQIRTTGRLGQQLLGINSRDDGPLLKTCTKEGINKIFLSGSDDRVFCCGIRLVRRQTVQQILNMIPRESEGESLEDALARVRRCVGGNATENADSDSDIEVVADFVTVNLRCPMSGSRMRIAGRFKACLHMGCFDLETFIELNQRSRKWQCPTCSKNYSLESIIIDPYFNRITSLMRNCGEDVNMIEVRSDGSWRAKNEGECRDNELCRWHLPDGSLCSMTNDAKTNYEMSRQLKQAGAPEGSTVLKFDLRRKGNGKWEVSKTDRWSPSSGNNVHEKSENQWQKVRPASSSGTGSYRDGEDASVNQGGAQFEISTSIGPDLDSLKDFFDQTFTVDHRVTPTPLSDANIILLSDSDEEDIPTIPPQTIYNTVPNPCNAGTTLSVNDPEVPADLGLSTSGTSSLGFFNSNVNDYGLPLWAMQSSPTEFQLFHSDGNVPDALIDEQGSLNCAPTDVCGLIPDDLVNVLQENNTLFTSNAEMNGSLVDNPLAYGNDDPSLKIFLPTQPDSEPVHQDMTEHPKLSNGGHADDWTSLTLAAGGAQTDAALAFGLNSGNQILSSENGSMTFDMDSLFLTRNNQKRNKATLNNQRSDSSFSYPHHPRSVRPRLGFSIDVDSDSQ